MNTAQFDKVVEHRLSESKRVLIEKAKEYAKDEDDKLHNFNRAAQITGECREKALFGFFLKHLVSVMDIVDEMNAKSTYIPNKALVEEKIGDSINYLLLLEASIEDKRNKSLPF
jgi:hypothetical protein